MIRERHCGVSQILVSRVMHGVPQKWPCCLLKPQVQLPTESLHASPHIFLDFGACLPKDAGREQQRKSRRRATREMLLLLAVSLYTCARAECAFQQSTHPATSECARVSILRIEGHMHDRTAPRCLQHHANEQIERPIFETASAV